MRWLSEGEFIAEKFWPSNDDRPKLYGAAFYGQIVDRTTERVTECFLKTDPANL